MTGARQGGAGVPNLVMDLIGLMGSIARLPKVLPRTRVTIGHGKSSIWPEDKRWHAQRPRFLPGLILIKAVLPRTLDYLKDS